MFAWRMEPIAATARTRAPQPGKDGDKGSNYPMEGKTFGYRGRATHYDVTWPQAPAEADGVVIEVARDRPDAEWFVACYPRERTDTTCPLVRRTGGSGVGGQYAGPLKFRAVPYRKAYPSQLLY